MLNSLRKMMPPGLKRSLKPFYLAWLDLLDTVTGHRKAGLPPSRLMLPQFGNRDASSFHEGARWMVQALRDRCNLQPDHRVLDVGCGVGRLAFGLLDFMDVDGGYAGLDVDRDSIEWASANIAQRHPHFRFDTVDIRNEQYNPDGKITATEYRFPFDEGLFDVVFLHSVFTHLMPDEVEHYLHEILRVLKPGGKAHISYYLVNDESMQLSAEGRSSVDFKHDFGVYRSISWDTPEYSVAFDEKFVRDLYVKCGFTGELDFYLGNWCGREEAENFQDIIVTARPS